MAHGGIANNVRVKLDWIDSEVFEAEEEAVRQLEGVHGILVPGGFGERGSEGKIEAARFARERQVPYFGICFGMQMAVIEAARHLAKLPGAGSTEFGPCEHPVIGLMTEWMRGNELEQRSANGDLGGTMRLGAYDAVLDPESRVAEIYGATRSASATATAMRSTSPIATRWRRRACGFPACRPTDCCRRSSKSPIIRGSSACSSTPS